MGVEGVSGRTKLLLSLLVPHGAATEDGHFSLGFCLHPFEGETFGAKKTTHQVELEGGGRREEGREGERETEGGEEGGGE